MMRSISGRCVATFPRPDRGLAMTTSGPNGLVMAGTWSWQQHPRVHDLLGVERGLDLLQHVHSGLAELARQEGGLQPSHAVMMGEGSARGGAASHGIIPRGQVPHLCVPVVRAADQEREV